MCVFFLEREVWLFEIVKEKVTGKGIFIDGEGKNVNMYRRLLVCYGRVWEICYTFFVKKKYG